MSEEFGPRRRRPLVIGVALVVVVLLVGGTLVGVIGLGGQATQPAVPPTSAPTALPADPALVATYPDDFTAESAAAETVRLGDAIIGLIDPAVVVNDDEIAQEVPASEADAGQGVDAQPGYFGVLHTLTLEAAVPAQSQADGIIDRLEAAGWTEQDSSVDQGFSRVVLVSGTDPATSWFALVGADASVPGESVVSVQLASPNLP